MTQIEATQHLAAYANQVYEQFSLIAAMHPYTVSRRGEIAFLVLDWIAREYSERRILATLKYFRDETAARGEYEYAETITAFLREYGQAKRKAA